MHTIQEVQIQHTNKTNDINNNTRATQQQHKHVLHTIYKTNHKHNTQANLNNNNQKNQPPMKQTIRISTNTTHTTTHDKTSTTKQEQHKSNARTNETPYANKRNTNTTHTQHQIAKLQQPSMSKTTTKQTHIEH